MAKVNMDKLKVKIADLKVKIAAEQEKLSQLETQLEKEQGKEVIDIMQKWECTTPQELNKRLSEWHKMHSDISDTEDVELIKKE
ncbi:MAG: hypothetical protein PUG10_01675 [Lachnospiraceae bacterium]|nr:hypothetical protein [Lachnospiraceae bacterium]